VLLIEVHGLSWIIFVLGGLGRKGSFRWIYQGRAEGMGGGLPAILLVCDRSRLGCSLVMCETVWLSGFLKSSFVGDPFDRERPECAAGNGVRVVSAHLVAVVCRLLG